MSRNLRLLYLHNLLTDFRFQAPFAIIYFEQIAGNYTRATVILAIEVIAAALFDIPTGIFSDKIGRKYTLAAGSASYALGQSCYAFADGYVWLIAGAILFGLSTALFSGNNDALLFESLKAQGEEKKFHHYQGRLSSMFQLGLGVSAVIASFIAPHGLRLVFICGIVPQVLAVFVCFFFVEPRTHIVIKEKSFKHLKIAFRQILRNRRLRLLTIGNSISYGVGEAVFTFSGAFVITLWPTWAVAIYRALANTLGFIGYWFAGRIIDRVKPAGALAFGATYGLVSELMAAFMANVFSPLVFVSGSLFFGPYMVARDHIMQAEFSDEQRATLGSVVSFVASFVGGAASLGLGVIADHFGLLPAMVAGILASGVGVPIYIRLFRKYF